MLSKELERLASENGKLPYYAWPGGYPILYIDKENEVVCPNCANAEKDKADDAEFDGEEHEPAFYLVSYFIHYEGAPEVCSVCNAEIESAYGDPESE